MKHNRGSDIFEAGNFRFGLEMHKQAGGDSGLAIHVLADLAGSPGGTNDKTSLRCVVEYDTGMRTRLLLTPALPILHVRA